VPTIPFKFEGYEAKYYGEIFGFFLGWMK